MQESEKSKILADIDSALEEAKGPKPEASLTDDQVIRQQQATIKRQEDTITNLRNALERANIKISTLESKGGSVEAVSEDGMVFNREGFPTIGHFTSAVRNKMKELKESGKAFKKVKLSPSIIKLELLNVPLEEG